MGQRTPLSVPWLSGSASLTRFFTSPPPIRDPGATYLDATPSYFPTPAAPTRIASVLPHARLVLLLKDPVARTVSAWNNRLKRTKCDGCIKDFATEVRVGGKGR